MRDHLCQSNPLTDLVKKRIAEIEFEMKRHQRNGSHATIRHFEKQRNKNIEILFQLERDQCFVESRIDR